MSYPNNWLWSFIFISAGRFEVEMYLYGTVIIPSIESFLRPHSGVSLRKVQKRKRWSISWKRRIPRYSSKSTKKTVSVLGLVLESLFLWLFNLEKHSLNGNQDRRDG